MSINNRVALLKLTSFQNEMKKLCDKYYIFDFTIVGVFKMDTLELLSKLLDSKKCDTEYVKLSARIRDTVQYYEVKQKHAKIVCDALNAALYELKLDYKVNVKDFYMPIKLSDPSKEEDEADI